MGGLIAVLDTVIVHKIPEAVRVGTAVAAEQHLVRSAGERAACQARGKCVDRRTTVVERRTACCACGGCVRSAEDAVGQVIRAVGGRDIVTNHAALAGRRGPSRAHSTRDRLGRAPVAARIG